MMARAYSPMLMLVLLATSCGNGHGDAERHSCVPSFREVSESPVRAEYGSWRITFAVALVACAEDLTAITDEQLRLLAEEFQEPAQWSNLLLVKDSKKTDFRAKVVARTNDLLGRELVADILFHDINLLDDNRPTLPDAADNPPAESPFPPDA